jgi:hypothetical protein
MLHAAVRLNVTRSLLSFSMVPSPSSFSTVLFPTARVCLGGKERRKHLVLESMGAKLSPHIATPCSIIGSGEEKGYRGKGALTPSLFFLGVLAETAGAATVLLHPPSLYAEWELGSTGDNLTSQCRANTM